MPTAERINASEKQRVIADLRAQLSRYGGVSADGDTRRRLRVMTTGAPDIDDVLPAGGLACRGLHEFWRAHAPESPNVGAALGFVCAILARAAAVHGGPIVWCTRARDLYAPGLADMGVPPERLIYVHPPNDKATLWVMEEALRSGAPAVVVGDCRDAPTVALRRLQLAAESGGVAGFLLGDEVESRTSPAITRWRIAPALSKPTVPGAPWLGAPRFQVSLLRCRGAQPQDWLVEWRDDEQGTTPGRFAVFADTADRQVVARQTASLSKRLAG